VRHPEKLIKKIYLKKAFLPSEYKWDGKIVLIEKLDFIKIKWSDYRLIIKQDGYGTFLYSPDSHFNRTKAVRFLQSLLTYLIKKEKKENLQNKIHPEQEDKPIVQADEFSSEDFHGGEESTQSIENSPSPSILSDSSQVESPGVDKEQDGSFSADNEISENESSKNENSKSEDSYEISSVEKKGGGFPVSDQDGQAILNQKQNLLGGKSSACQSQLTSLDENGQDDVSNQEKKVDASCLKEDKADNRLSIDCHKVYIPESCEKNTTYGGGGSQLDTSLEVSSDARIAQCVERLLTGGGVRKVTGQDHCWSRPVVKSIVTANAKALLQAKYEREPEKIYLFLDTSGSVSYLSEVILKILKSCIKSSKIDVWTGSEAHPVKNEKTGVRFKYHHNFSDNMKIFLKNERPTIGSTFIFLGDLMDSNIDLSMKKILIPYRAVWLWTEQNSSYKGCDIEIAKKVGFKIVKGVNSVNRFISALRNI